MDVLIAGGHGKIALRLARLLSDRGDQPRGIIRDDAQSGDLVAAGAEPVLFDLEGDGDLVPNLARADAVVFAAGAGPGSGPERKRTVDYGAAVKLIEACKTAGVDRYVIVSAMGADREGGWSDQMRPYYEAKRDADEALSASGLEFTIVRPGGLTNDPGTGLIEVGTPLSRRGQVTREDVAATIVAALDEPGTAGVAFDLLNGETPITEAIGALAR